LNKEPTPDFVPLIFSNLVVAFLLAYIFDTWAKIRTVIGGFKGGAIIMFLMAAFEPPSRFLVNLISSLVKISETDNQQQKPTENPRLSPLFSVHECSCFSIQLAQNRHSK